MPESGVATGLARSIRAWEMAAVGEGRHGRVQVKESCASIKGSIYCVTHSTHVGPRWQAERFHLNDGEPHEFLWHCDEHGWEET